jgi:hypothetical protein
LKLAVLILCLAFLSAVVVARDLSSVARKERTRRQAIHSSREPSETFTNIDLDTYPARERVATRPRPSRHPRNTERDLEKEEAFWRKEKSRYERERARLDANIRRLEWRLRDRQLKARLKGRRREDTAVALIEQTLETLREEREEMELDFRERARKASAFPGWLR